MLDEKLELLPDESCKIQLSYKNNLHCCNKVIYDSIIIKYAIGGEYLESQLNIIDGLLNSSDGVSVVTHKSLAELPEEPIINSNVGLFAGEQQYPESYLIESSKSDVPCHLKIEPLNSAGKKMMMVGKVLTLEYKITNVAEETALLTFKSLPPSIYRDVGDEHNCDEHLKSYDYCVLKLLVYPTEPEEIVQKYLVFANFFSLPACHSSIDIALTARENIYAQDLQATLDNSVDEVTKQPRTQLHLYNLSSEQMLKIVSVNVRELSTLGQRNFSFKKYLLPQDMVTLFLSQAGSPFFVPLSEKYKEGIIYILEVKFKNCTTKWYEMCEKKESIIRVPMLKLLPTGHVVTDTSKDKSYV